MITAAPTNRTPAQRRKPRRRQITVLDRFTPEQLARLKEVFTPEKRWYARLVKEAIARKRARTFAETPPVNYFFRSRAGRSAVAMRQVR